MAFTKAHLYPADLQIIGKNMKPYTNPARLQILYFLLQHGPSCVQDIARHHPISLESISGHLAKLRERKLVIARERFPYTFYSINHTRLKAVIRLLVKYLSSLE